MEAKIITALDLRRTNLKGLGKQDALRLSVHIELFSGFSDPIHKSKTVAQHGMKLKPIHHSIIYSYIFHLLENQPSLPEATVR